MVAAALDCHGYQTHELILDKAIELLQKGVT